MNPTTRRAHANESNDPKVHSGSLCSFRRALGDVLVVRVRSVQTGAFWMWSGSFGFVGFLRGVPVNFGTLGSFRHILEVVGFIRARIWCRRFFWGSLCSFERVLGVVGLIWARTWGCRVRWVCSCATLVSLGSFWFIYARHGGHPVHLGFIRVCLGASWCRVSFCFVWSIRALPVGRWVHSGAPCVSLGSRFHLVRLGVAGPVHIGTLGSFGRILGVVRFIWVRWVHSTSWGSFGSLGFVAPWGSLGSFEGSLVSSRSFKVRSVHQSATWK